MKPGLTGLWQVSGRNERTYEEMVSLDVKYVQSRSLRGDLAILVEQASTRLSGIDAKLHLGDVGDPHLVATFTKWNEPVTVVAPPADQVAAP